MYPNKKSVFDIEKILYFLCKNFVIFFEHSCPKHFFICRSKPIEGMLDILLRQNNF